MVIHIKHINAKGKTVGEYNHFEAPVGITNANLSAIAQQNASSGLELKAFVNDEFGNTNVTTITLDRFDIELLKKMQLL